MHRAYPKFCFAVFSVVLSLSTGRADALERQAAVPTPSTQVLTVVNTVPDFLAFWTAAESKDEPTQVRMFRQMVMQVHPELFSESIVELGQKQGERSGRSPDRDLPGSTSRKGKFMYAKAALNGLLGLRRGLKPPLATRFLRQCFAAFGA